VNQSDGTVALQANPLPASSVGDAGRGRKLFMGNLHFQNGGPPCMGCHNVGSNGILGGGALGPDLTNVAARRSQSELAEILASPVSVAKPIYSEHPLTAEEQADLLAFLNASVGQPETNREWLVIGISLIGFLAAVGLIELVYHRRLRGVRKPMLRKTYAQHR
jgi:mono/diheme cytochrome c family protein